MTHLTYLSMDSMAEGIGSSQVLAYAVRIVARGIDVELHSFEKRQPAPELLDAVAGAGVDWHIHDFGAGGSRAGLGRVVRAAAAVRRRPLLHARSDLAAAAALLARPRRWVWDMRSFWSDELLAMGRMRAHGPEERVMRAVERAAAQQSDAIVTLAATALPTLEARHGPVTSTKANVITTCVDLTRFEVTELPPGAVRLGLLGTVNRAYDVPVIVAFVGRATAELGATLSVYAPGPSVWDTELEAVTGERRPLAFADVPNALAHCHAGLSMWRPEMGVALQGAMPTKIGEFLAAGRPVVVNRGLGDMDAVIAEHNCGVVLEGADDSSLGAGVTQLAWLLADPATPGRCRAAAEAHFDLERGVDRLATIYRTLR